MKTASRVFYVLISIGFVVLWLVLGVDYVRSGQLKALLPDLPMILILLICVGVAVGLAIFYLYHRGDIGALSDPNQFGCVVLIALFVVALVALVVAFILAALGVLQE